MITDAGTYTALVTLEGTWVRLEPLTLDHVAPLFAVAESDDIWRYMPVPTPKLVEDVRLWVNEALELHARGQALPFVIIERATGKPIGSTRYLDVSPRDRHVEIGWTWLAPAYWRTPINTECKYLLLRYAFETLGCIRVALKTDSRNERSQRAIERIGAAREGVLRRVVIMHDGYQRSSVYYSVLANEWSAVKVRLEARMGVL